MNGFYEVVDMSLSSADNPVYRGGEVDAEDKADEVARDKYDRMHPVMVFGPDGSLHSTH